MKKLIIFFLFLAIIGCQKEYSYEGGPKPCGSFLIVAKDTAYQCNGMFVSFLGVQRPDGRTMWLYPGNKEEFDSLKVGQYFKF